MKLGVSGMLPADWRQIDVEVARSVRAAGFLGAQWFFPRPLESDRNDVRRVREAFRQAGLEVAQVNGSYERLVDSDERLRAEGIRGMQALVLLGVQAGAPSVFVRPGSLNTHHHWGPHPGNHTPETFERLVNSLQQVCRVAASEGVTLAIEGHVLSPLDTARRVRELFDAVGSPALKFNIDPVNFIGTVGDVHDTRTVLNDLFDLLGPDTVVAHAKDVAIGDNLVVHIEEVLLGTGTLDYPLFLRRFQKYSPNGWMQIEHLPNEKVPLAREALVRIAGEAGIPLEF